MKKIAILVIAAFNQEVYKHYINTYWTDLINYTNKHKPNISIYLLFDRDMDLANYESIRGNIIVDGNTNYNGFVKEKQGNFIPGILSKTVYAFEKLQQDVDVIFRTNLSSMIHLPKFEKYVKENDILYSGAYSWTNALRSHLVYLGKIGPKESIKSLEDLAEYEGNTFISGCGYFLNKKEINHILEHKEKIRYDIIDDVSIGLMLKDFKILHNFLMKVDKSDTQEIVLEKLAKDNIHVRLEHLPLEKAKEVYHIIKKETLNYLPQHS